jgi:hypothetical protein
LSAATCNVRVNSISSQTTASSYWVEKGQVAGKL